MFLYQIILIVANQFACIFEARSDVNREAKNKTIKHVASAWFRGIAWALSSTLLHWRTPGMAFLLALVLGLQYWLTFNPFHNHFKKQAWWYSGGGVFDSILHGQGNRYKNIALKLGLLLIFGYIYVNIYVVVNSR